MKRIVLGCALLGLLQLALLAEPGNQVVLTVPSTKATPRNSEGAFVTLKSGRIVLYFTQFSSGSSDFDHNSVAEVHSDDQGMTWTQPTLVARPPGGTLSMMVLCVLRLADGRIALAYDRKDSFLECHPYIQFSADEGATWSQPALIAPGPGYYTINNDRMIQLRSGRLILPMGFDRSRSRKNDISSLDERSLILWFLSDDGGATWREGKSAWGSPVPSASGLQEPGVVELADGSLLSWARSDAGCQFEFHSHDGGETWSRPVPSELKSPCSPASIKRLPGTSDLLAVFNDHSGWFPFPTEGGIYRHRTPLVAAVSTDDGKTWPMRKLLENDPRAEFAYIAIHFVGDSVLLAYSFNPTKGAHLGTLRIRRLATSWLRK